MNTQLNQIIEESLKLELNVADLYELFSNAFPEDSSFWNKLSLEEKNHADLIKTGKELLATCDEFPPKILAASLDEIIKANNKLSSLLKEYKNKAPLKEDAFAAAIFLEEAAGEIHFQNAISKDTNSSYIKIFQELNKDDKDHAQRIREYMNSKGIK